jgi:hypothetical protein
MKNLLKYTSLAFMLLFMLSSGCKKDREDEPAEDLITTNYTGWLDVYFSNTVPPFEASTQIDVDIDKDLDMILFETGTLSYSGDTIIGDDSKIERTGNWIIEPTGDMEKAGTDVHINVDGGITIVSDIQKIYAKSNGNWILVNETDFASSPNADIFFSLNEALVGNGSVVQVTTPGGSIRFTLHLLAKLD